MRTCFYMKTIFYILFFFICFTNCQKTDIKDDFSPIVSDNISNQYVTSFLEDELGFMWIGTYRGLNRFNSYDYHQYYYNEKDSLSVNGNKIQTLFKDSKNNIWVGTSNGISLYNRNDYFDNIFVEIVGSRYGAIQFLENQQGDIFANMGSYLCKYIPEKKIFEKVLDFDINYPLNRCCIDGENKLWVNTQTSIKCYNSRTFELVMNIGIENPTNFFYSYLQDGRILWYTTVKTFNIIDTYTMESVPVPTVIAEDKILFNAIIMNIHPYDDNSLLFNTHKNGLFLYNKQSGKLMHQSDQDFPFEVPKSEITALYTDSNKNLWIGSSNQGYVVRYKYNQQFNNNNVLHNLTENKSVTSLCLDKKNNHLWIATYMDGLIVYNYQNGNINTIDLRNFFPENPFFLDKISQVYAAEECIWLLTDAKLIRCRYSNGILHREYTFPLPNKVHSFVEDKAGNIWVSSSTQDIFVIPKGSNSFRTINLYPKGNYYKSDVTVLQSGKILVTTSNQNLKLIDPADWSVKEIDIQPYINSRRFTQSVVYQDSSRVVWIGTTGQGLYKIVPDSEKLIKINGFHDNDIASIINDADGNLWVGTQNGLSMYNISTEKIITYYAYDGTGGNQYNDRSVCMLPDNTLFFGGTHGLTFFNPKEVSVKRKIPLYFENLKIHNNIVHVRSGNEIDTAMVYTPSVKLSYDEDDISISYVALDYSEYPRIRYYYKMEGLDNQWINARNNREAYYSNLPSGNYSFKVKVTNVDDSEIIAESIIPVYIKKAPWFSTWAICLYSILIIVIIIYISNLYIRIRINKSKAQMAIREKEHEAYINRMNMSFFSNISHEFRTPLTMIAGPITMLNNRSYIQEEDKRLLNIVQRSINRMLRLVNQLMDFNRLENDALKLNVKRRDIVFEINDILDIFSINARNKQIELITNGLEQSFFMILDKDKLEKILANILSNALKFTPKGGQIKLTFSILNREQVSQCFAIKEDNLDSEYATITVEDSGPGIPEDKLGDIFKRYYQIDSNTNGIYNWGTGIGLYYTKRLIDLHHGYIKADNRETGGSIFSFALPVNKESYSSEEYSNIAQDNELAYQKYDENEFVLSAKYKQQDKSKTILIVDDDVDISYYMQSLLEPYYKVINKYDAKSAYNLIEQISPDLIISDVVMPEIDGYQFCKMIKENISYCHIPVILLTAKTLIKEQIEGLEMGANVYVTKPFDPHYLLALVKSQLKNQEYARKVLSNSTKTETIDKDILSPQDKLFIGELYKLMEKEMSNSELNITKMTEVLKISRSKLYYKIKSLTGENPNVFFRKYKLNRASELLLEGKYNVSEIADMTGFSTPSMFSASFKKQFGVTPREYKG